MSTQMLGNMYSPMVGLPYLVALYYGGAILQSTLYSDGGHYFLGRYSNKLSFRRQLSFPAISLLTPHR